MAGLQALDGFLSARWRHRLAAHVLLRRRDGAVLLVQTTDGWTLPGGAVRADASPRAAVGAALLRLALESAVGRLLARVREAQALGVIGTREEALAFLDSPGRRP